MKTIRNVVCPFCGSLCDDIEVDVEDNRVVKVRKGCAISATKFTKYNEERIYKPRIDGREVSLEEAINEAVEILANAKYPALYGWSCTSTEAINIGIEIAELVGGVMDNTASVCHGPTILGEQDAGISTCTLGQVKNRAELIIYWGCNPAHAHPRHMARYSAASKGRFVKGRKERTVIVVDVRKTHTAKTADIFIQIKPNSDFELLTALRWAVKNGELEQEEIAGIPAEKIEELADILISCRFGALFFGLGLTMSAGKARNIEAAVNLVRELNNYTKFVMVPMRGHFNVTGANEVMAWATGFPFAVDFSRGYPFYNPGDTTFVDVLTRGDCDAALIVASDPVSGFPAEAIRNLAKIPVITLDPHETLTTMISKVVIPTAVVGIEAEGSAYRMDAVPLRLKKLVEPPPGILSDEEVLKMILKKLKERVK